ncbi:MAG: TIGR04076 family protein [Solobacterium sp.]|nr:TIGR04076 family protein [Solobacterium sp.]MCH4048472.1 TIGR04076 family protein [Solobacterium sp.]MCH4074676.1 TIGR04076 family protein [Solobacterium sp.]MCI1408616.1 TIGR04076 family protein [Solobacterium sp.]MCI1436786.1 TIGR04076 family protein [Solobacterium sp.]
MAHGTDEFFPDWIRVPKTTINCCNDGIRPVIFKLEAMENTEQK